MNICLPYKLSSEAIQKEARLLHLTPLQFCELMEIPFSPERALPRQGLQKPPLPQNHSRIYGPPPQKTQGQYTREDYILYPASKIPQLIDGYLVYNDSVPSIHQSVVTDLLYQMLVYLENTGLPFKVISTPVSLYLPDDIQTAIRPDIALIRHPGKILKNSVSTLPCFIAEVLSPSTHCLDCLLKLHKYYKANIPEYWIIDTDTRLIYTLHSTSRQAPAGRIFRFLDHIPVPGCPGLSLTLKDFS